MIPHPPELSAAQLQHSVALRFVANAGVAQQIVTFQNLLDTLLMATSATQPYDVFQLVKVRKVEVWSCPAIGSSNTISVDFSGQTVGSLGDADLHTDTSMGIEPAHVCAVPKKRSQVSQFQLSSGNTAFVLNGVASGTVVDVHLSFKQLFLAQTGSATASSVSVGATVGLIYTRGLDGIAAATTKFPCVIGSAI
jgi:hypothetical protein